jgi:phosphatidylserine/phosphatidylglycerophosphate/cardiolipin synthase-like enzyme
MRVPHPIVLSAWVLLLCGCSAAPEPPLYLASNDGFMPSAIDLCPMDPVTNCAKSTPFGEIVAETERSAKFRSLHYVNILEIGEQALLLRLHLIKSAQKSIYIQQFIWSADEAGLLLFRELIAAARRGVEVKVVIDQLSALGDARLMAALVRAHENFEIKIYNPVSGELEASYLELALAGLVRLSGINQRMHNKLMLVDGAIALLGGRNHENRYFDLDEDYNFKDRDILAIGPVVKSMTASFWAYWDYKYAVPAYYLKDVQPYLGSGECLADVVGGEGEAPAALEDIERKASDFDLIESLFVSTLLPVLGRVAFYADSPGKPYEGPEQNAAAGDATALKSSYRGLYEVGQEAEDNVVIQTPYLILTEEAMEAIRQRREQHPGLRIVASTNSLASIDHFLAYAIMIKQRKRLLQILQFRIFEFKPIPGDVRRMVPRYDRLAKGGKPCERDAEGRMPVRQGCPIIGLHGKSIVIDDRISYVGSHNFDPRSAIFDTQVAIAIWDADVSRALKANILRDTEPQNSWVVAPRQRPPVIAPVTGLIESISRALPVGDLWPFNYSANFELRAGESPVPPEHPEFYRRYINRGQFPDVDRPEKVIEAVLTRVMGGFATPLM